MSQVVATTCDKTTVVRTWLFATGPIVNKWLHNQVLENRIAGLEMMATSNLSKILVIGCSCYSRGITEFCKLYDKQAITTSRAAG